MKKTLSVLLICITATFFAQKNSDVTLYFSDGSILNGNAKMNDINLTASYGKVTVKLKNISSIEFGLGKDESIKGDVTKQIQLLTTLSDEKAINGAKDNISKYGVKAIFYLDEYLNGANATNTDRVQQVLDDILSSNNLTSYHFEDIINLSNGDRISGYLDFNAVEFKNDFLSAKISTDKIKSMDVFYTESTNGQSFFSVKAAKYISSNNNGGWLSTGIKVNKGQTIELTAKGEIILASLDNKKYLPDGYVSGEQPPATDANPDVTYFNYGTLLFKIGSNGKMMRAGSNMKYIANASGIIYLSIYETVYSDKNTGAYNVVISVK